MAKKSSAHTLEYILLGLLQEEPAHGYALYEKLRKTPELSLIWQIKRSKLYYLLDKLENEGLLTSSIKSQEPYPDRKVFQVTPRGQELLEGWLFTPVKSSRFVRLSFLSKLYFLNRNDRQLAAELIARQIESCRGWLASLEEQRQSLGRDDFISSQVYLFRIGQITAMISWLENCRDALPA